jgi:hypothetical protein
MKALTPPSASLRAPLSQNLGEGTLERSDSRGEGLE